MSDTKNVKIGVCQILLNGQDLGYTKGGVEVQVKTDTHKVQIDQFGNTPINEYIMGREVTVKVPMAETTLDNLAQVMPGATLYSNGTAATGTITIGATLPTDGETIEVGGVTVTFKAAAAQSSLNEVLIGASATATATNLAAVLANGNFADITAVAAAGVVTLTYSLKNAVGNTYALSAGTASASVTVSGAYLTGGTDGTVMRVDVPTGVGTNLLDFAVPLTLHPVSRAAGDHSEDFTVYKAGTAGALNFAYDINKERIFDVNFTGYPDATGRLFGFGDPAAV